MKLTNKLIFFCKKIGFLNTKSKNFTENNYLCKKIRFFCSIILC